MSVSEGERVEGRTKFSIFVREPPEKIDWCMGNILVF